MNLIRKFVVGAAGAGIATAALLMSPATGTAQTRTFDDHFGSPQAPSAACTAAIQAIRDAVVVDRTEDAAERAVANTEGADPADRTEDAAERAHFISLFKAARTACAPANPGAAIAHSFAPSPACTAAVQALKAAWAQGRPATLAQWQHLQSLFMAVRSACGFQFGR